MMEKLKAMDFSEGRPEWNSNANHFEAVVKNGLAVALRVQAKWDVLTQRQLELEKRISMLQAKIEELKRDYSRFNSNSDTTDNFVKMNKIGRGRS